MPHLRPFLLLPLVLAAASAFAKPVVQTSNYPLAYFVQRIAGDQIDVQLLAPADGDPAFWEPSDAEIAKLQAADKILLNGATYEKWLDHVTLPDSLLVNTSEGFASQYIEIKDAATHSHGKKGEHSHAGTAFTTWIDFAQARQQAEAILPSLVRLLPVAQADFATNAQGLFADLDKLDRELSAAAKAIGTQPLVASHPVYHYLARRYGLNIDSVLWEPDVVPDDKALESLSAVLAKHPAKWMIWEGEPAKESVVKLEALGVRSVVFDPCGNRPEQGDWLRVMQDNLGSLKTIPTEP
jgi:zinc transport system substrate-binding protein